MAITMGWSKPSGNGQKGYVKGGGGEGLLTVMKSTQTNAYR